MDAQWLRMLNEVIDYGSMVVPRGKPTLELQAHTLIADMVRPVLTVAARKLGYRFMAAEAAWILSGRDDVESIKPYSKTIENFSDDGSKFFGAYGPKIMEQIACVVETLKGDRESRQAVANIWRENPPKSKDIPCTLSVQFLIRQGRLDCHVTMRSSDVWLGVPYDVFNFSMLSAYVLIALDDYKLKLGNLYNTAASRHFYLENMPAAKVILDGERAAKFTYQPLVWQEFKSTKALVDHLWRIAGGGHVQLYDWFVEALGDR